MLIKRCNMNPPSISAMSKDIAITERIHPNSGWICDLGWLNNMLCNLGVFKK